MHILDHADHAAPELLPTPALPVLIVHLFGRFRIQRHEQQVEGFDVYKVQELFSFLVLHRDRPHARESLAGTLWGDIPTAQSKKYLRQALWQLQTALGQHSTLIVEPDWVRLDVRSALWIDVVALEEAFARAQGTPGALLDPQSVQLIERAVQVYRGDLLEGWYQDWCLIERERLQNNYLALLDKLMGYCEAHHAYDAGIAYGAEILRYDRARERTHWRLMRLHAMAGDRSGALRQYERCIAALRDELGVMPEKRTLALYEQICADTFADPSINALAVPLISSESTALLPDVLGRLNQFQEILADMQSHIRQDIQAIERALGDRASGQT